MLLAVVSGATDAVGFISLGGSFTSVMTGNMVLLGLSAGQRNGDLAAHAAAAILAFVIGVAVGTRIAGSPREGDPVWPRAVTRALTVEYALFVAFAVGWEITGGRPTADVTQVALLALNAIALGIQSATILRFGIPGLSTTYMTGTLTTAVARLATGRRPSDVARQAEILGGLIFGAAIGAVIATHAIRFSPLLQLPLLSVVLVGARRISR